MYIQSHKKETKENNKRRWSENELYKIDVAEGEQLLITAISRE